MAKKLVGVNTLAHFCVDFACHYAFFALFAPQAGAAALGALLYNGVAFALQPFIGMLCDRRRRFPVGLAGCVALLGGLLLCAAPLGRAAAWPGLLLCALGNAGFHVGGGTDCLVVSAGRMWGSGVFVASGALGVALGAMAGRAGVTLWLPLGMVALCALLLWRLPRPLAGPSASFGAASGRRGPGVVIALCALAVVIRAYGGGLVPAAWAAGGWLALVPAGCAALGKGLGGFVADRLGARVVGTASMLLAAVLLGLFAHIPALCALGLVCFNLCMPITLCALADCLPGYPGFAFGLTTLGLFAGWLPLALWGAPQAAGGWVAGLCVVSAVCLLAAAGGKKRRSDHV